MTADRATGQAGMLPDAVYQRLIELILSNELPPDSRVNLYQVARQLDVSPTPVREALSRLDDDGLVVKSPLKGYRTTPVLDVKELDDLFDLRLLLEPVAAQKAAENGSSEALETLVEEAGAFPRAPAGDDAADYASFCRHDGQLHALIAQASGNTAIARSLARTHFHLHAFRLGYEESAGQATLDEHVRIAAAVARRDADGAADAMRAHLLASRERLLPLARRP
ncbi:GntR family transcriptional regulator [Microbacterium sp. PMB16]|uniref:GntR family transcriptional regulator n=1 Tax=Microbacterium sp. PMB16 TaxID=3120157 RepID=UPI003F4BBEC0